MIRVLLLLALTLSSNAMATSGRVLCMTMTAQIEEVRAHMPMKIDDTVSVVDLLVSYDEPICTLDYQARIDSKGFADFLASVGDLTSSEYLEWLKTEEGHDAVKEEIELLSSQISGPQLDTFKAVDDTKLVYTYNYDDETIKPIVVTLLDTSK